MVVGPLCWLDVERRRRRRRRRKVLTRVGNRTGSQPLY